MSSSTLNNSLLGKWPASFLQPPGVCMMEAHSFPLAREVSLFDVIHTQWGKTGKPTPSDWSLQGYKHPVLLPQFRTTWKANLALDFPVELPVTGKHVRNATTVCSSTSASDTSCFPPSLTGADLECIPRKTTC